MAGYYNYSMSNNAIEAYRTGEAPASKIGHAIPAALVRRFCRPSSWHHTSLKFNRTDFYEIEEVLATFGKIVSAIYKTDPEAIAALAQRSKPTEQRYHNCTVEWVEWGGTSRHPRAYPRELKNVEVVVRGAFAYFAGMKKKVGGNHFNFSGEEVAE